MFRSGRHLFTSESSTEGHPDKIAHALCRQLSAVRRLGVVDLFRPDGKAQVDLVRAHFPLTPRGIMQTLDLRRPIYRATAAYGHFGRSEAAFTWERTDRAATLRADAGLPA